MFPTAPASVIEHVRDVAEQRQVDQRVLHAALDRHEAHEQRHAGGGEAERREAQPAPGRAAVDRERDRRDARGDGDQAAVVDRLAPTGRLDSLDVAQGQDHRADRERCVEEEDPAPVDQVGEQAADERADRRCRWRRCRRRCRSPCPRVSTGNALEITAIPTGKSSAAPSALDEAEADEHLGRLGRAAQERREAEHPEPREQDALAAEQVAEPAAGDQQRRQRELVDGDRPLQVRRGDVRARARSRGARG